MIYGVLHIPGGISSINNSKQDLQSWGTVMMALEAAHGSTYFSDTPGRWQLTVENRIRQCMHMRQVEQQCAGMSQEIKI